jgi:hypothetical protein
VEHFRELLNKSKDLGIGVLEDLRRDADEEERNVQIPS